MAPHWDAVKRLLCDLVKKAQYVDEDGMDLKFTASHTQFRASNKVEAFEKELSKPSNYPMGTHETNMSTTLGPILADYLDVFMETKKKARKMTIIILTDGKWGAMLNKFAVDNKIVEFNKKLQEALPNALEDDGRRLSIQFVQFGNDRPATVRLKRLDNKLKFRGVP